MMDKVSVIVPVYNAKLYLQRCLNSILEQTYKNLEILLIDDGSIDGSSEICDEYLKKDNRIKVFHLKNAGVSNARNTGLSFASGKYIVFVDADDVIHKKAIEILHKTIRETNLGCVICKAKVYTDQQTISTDWTYSVGNIQIFQVDNSYDYSSIGETGTVWGGIYSKKAIDAIKFQTGIYVSEDVLFNATVFSKTHQFGFLPIELYGYIIHSKSSIHGEFDDKKMTAIKAWEMVAELFSSYPDLYNSTIACQLLCCYRCVGEELNNQIVNNKRYIYMCNLFRKKLGFHVSKYINLKLLIKMYFLSCFPRIYKLLYRKKLGRK